MNFVPAFQDAKEDRDLRGSPMTVYLHLLDVLHPMEWRELKQLALCQELKLSESTVIRALNTLAANGYIERETGIVATNRARRWRLIYARSIEPTACHG